MMDQKANSIVSELHDEIYGLRCDIGRLEQENAKLTKVLHEVESEAVDAYLSLQHDCELLVGELDDMFKKYWHEQCENDKLKKLVGDLYAFYAWADGATHYGGEPAVFPDDRREIEQRMREVGMLEARELETEA